MNYKHEIKQIFWVAIALGCTVQVAHGEAEVPTNSNVSEATAVANVAAETVAVEVVPQESKPQNLDSKRAALAKQAELEKKPPLPMGDDPTEPSLMQEGVKTIIMLLILLVGFWWFSNWLKKSGKLARIAGSNGGIECLSVYSVGQKEKIALIRVRGEELLVGITQQSIQRLHHFTDTESGDMPESAEDKDAPSDTEFATILDTTSRES